MNILFSSLRTGSHWHGLLLRFTLGAVILPHGCQLLLGWFDGFGFNVSMQYFTGTVGLPWLIGFLVILIQFVGSIFLLAGFASRLVALAMTILFFGMITTSHLDHGFFMNWIGIQKGEGVEYHILAIGLALTILLTGSGRYSIDQAITSAD
ncbi:DoxX family protein [Flavihumibacter stibioxidans]|uniref:DoxX family protein n=1 Tax=Flavihumibacter stibioxidans TaxID=1834163 RepID=A0ABR7M990_9BACT|nr:DoxX family protein [Flavihumibacter stibioxidans]MBC6491414.1 hypothetical protein [Flavihumibacter stibioxidans]